MMNLTEHAKLKNRPACAAVLLVAAFCAGCVGRTVNSVNSV